MSDHHVEGAAPGVHVSSVKFNLIILGALLFLTILTYWTATMDLGNGIDTPLALAIAAGKTALVMLFFMHVKYSSHLTKILSVTGFGFLVLFFGFTFADLLSRTPEQPWEKNTWMGAAHRTGIIPDVPASEGHSVEHDAPEVEAPAAHH